MGSGAPAAAPARAPNAAPPGADGAPAAPRRPVFCVVDPSLRDFVGHHFAYDHAVAGAAEAAGFEAVALGHREVIPEIARAMRVEPCFRRGIWGRHRAARGVPGLTGRLLDHALCILDFARDLRRGLNGVAPPPGSVVLGHMITAKHLPGFAQVLGRGLPRGVTAVLLLRYQPLFYDNPIAARAFRRLERLAAAGRPIRLASDSERLAERIGRLTSLPVEVLPIPHAPPVAAPPAAPSPAAPGPARLRLVSLGNARDEKGFLEILEAVGLLQAEPGGLDGLEFVLQANDAAPDLAAATEAFAAACPPQVTLLPRALDGAAYEAALAGADAVLLPYWRSIYEARTSGVFLEAVAAGKPVIATAGTWMSDELARHGAGLTVPDRDPAALAAAIRRLAAGFPALARRAREDAPRVRARHSAAALVAQAAAAPPPRVLAGPRPPRRLAVFYPWGDFGERRAGASRRVGLMVDVLAPLAEEVRVLHAGWPPDRREGNVLAVAAPPRLRLHMARRAFRLATRPLVGREGWGQELPLWWHLERHLDPRFRHRVREIVRWSDAVLLEYPFWGRVVQAECRRQGVPCVVTAHDVLAEVVTGSALLRRATAALETAALRRADHAVCVSARDAARFAERGVRTPSVVPNPADLDLAEAPPPPVEPRALLRDLFDVRLPPGPVCLFVGSDYAPNRAAADRVRALARGLASAGPAAAGWPRPAFVLAGGCAPPGRDGAVLALGRVEEEVLAALYRLAAVVLIPLPHGTGSSLKTVEAMGWGRPVLGTAAAFRGLPVTPGADCVQEDDPSRWPEALAGLLLDPGRRASIGAAGRRLARGFGHRRVFAAYPALLGLPRPDEAAAAAQEDEERRRRWLAERRALVGRALERDRLDLARALLDSAAVPAVPTPGPPPPAAAGRAKACGADDQNPSTVAAGDGHPARSPGL